MRRSVVGEEVEGVPGRRPEAAVALPVVTEQVEIRGERLVLHTQAVDGEPQVVQFQRGRRVRHGVHLDRRRSLAAHRSVQGKQWVFPQKGVPVRSVRPRRGGDADTDIVQRCELVQHGHRKAGMGGDEKVREPGEGPLGGVLSHEKQPGTRPFPGISCRGGGLLEEEGGVLRAVENQLLVKLFQQTGPVEGRVDAFLRNGAPVGEDSEPDSFLVERIEHGLDTWIGDEALDISSVRGHSHRSECFSDVEKGDTSRVLSH